MHLTNSHSSQQEIYNLIPEKKIGDWQIRKDKQEKRIILMVKDACWMSNTDHEYETHKELFDKAKGDVLIAGLGLGYAPMVLKEMSKVKTIDIVEKEKEVIELVAKHISHEKIRIHHFKISEYLNFRNKSYDIIFFDVFPDDPCYFEKDTEFLINQSMKLLKPEGEVIFWRQYPKLDL